MTRYISEPVPADRAGVRQIILDALAAEQPDVDIKPGTLLSALVSAIATLGASNRQLLTEVLAIIFRYSAEKIDRTPQRGAVQATGTTTWTRRASDTAERTVAAGAQLTIRATDGTNVPFETTAPFTFEADETTAASVAIVASTGGSDGNALQTGAQAASTLSWLESITVDAPTSGGEDAEDDAVFLDRIADTKPLRLNAIIRPEDIVRFGRNQPGVDRVLVLPNYDPADPDTPAGGHYGAIPIDVAGNGLIEDARDELAAAMAANTVDGVQVHVLEPADTTVAVVFAGVARPGYATDDVNTRAEQAVLDFLARTVWGLSEGGDQRDWNETPVLYHQDVSAVLNGVRGFERWTTLTLNGVADDLELATPGALPAADSTVTGTVVLP